MYSFEGEYRRTPQQKLCGASSVLDRDQLLARARQRRQERENQRKRSRCIVLIQSIVRSYLTRIKHKREEKQEFDALLKGNKDIIKIETLEVATKKLLFFYWVDEDGQRLLLLSHLILREHGTIVRLAADPKSSWNRLICRLLALNYELLSKSDGPATVPLRLLEIFTSLSLVSDAVGPAQASVLVISVLKHLIPRGYLSKMRTLLEKRAPPLLVSSPKPPSPLAGSLLDLIIRPLDLVHILPPNEFRGLLQRLCLDVLSPRYGEVMQLYVIPALANLPSFPIREMIEAIHDLSPEFHTPWLLFSLLHLEKRFFKPNGEAGISELIYYLSAVASLTKSLRNLSSDDKNDDDDDDLSDDEDEVESEEKKHEKMVLEECVKLLNDEVRVEALLLAVQQTRTPLVVFALCKVCHNILLSSKKAVHNCRLLYMLAFKPTFLKQLWDVVSAVSQTSIFGKSTPLIKLIARGSPLTDDETQQVVPLLAVFSSLFSLLLSTLHDSEFYGDPQETEESTVTKPLTNPFSLAELMVMSRTLKDVSLGLVNLAYPDARTTSKENQSSDTFTVTAENTILWSNLFKVVVNLVNQLHARDNHRSFCPEGHWVSSQLKASLDILYAGDVAAHARRLRGRRPFRITRAFTREDMEVEGPPLTTKEIRIATLLQELPFLVAFQERVIIFQTIVMNDKVEHQGQAVAFLHGPSIHISVRRNYLYEDAFEQLSLENEPELRWKMRVELVNKVGLGEAGVDGGGIFREFLTELLKTAFDPNRGFFKLTNDNLLYPNPNVVRITPSFFDHYYFIGRILGKALYENLLVELPMAEFFLQKLVGKRSDVDMHHLESLDPVLYKNLLFLKNYDGDVQELGLDFTVLNEELGERTTCELKPDGASITVTNSNRIEYIHLVADYRLNKQLLVQCTAFRAGLTRVIPLEWIHMFNSKELQVLIAGAEVPVDVEDLKANTEYNGGYTPEHPTIIMFWNVLYQFSDLQKKLLLKFVTSCSRPPLLGFKELDPPFCVQNAGCSDRLPTASTCMNLLKLPEFSEEQLLKEKLAYAITAGAGFELS